MIEKSQKAIIMFIIHLRKRTAQRVAENDTRKGFKFTKKSEKSTVPTGDTSLFYSSNFVVLPLLSRNRL